MTRLLSGSLQTIQPHVAGVMSGQREEKGGWSETEATFTLHLPPLPPPLQSEEKKSFPVFNEVSTSFQRFPFSRADSPADPGGPGADCERQRVCEEDQHGHREDLHPSRVQLLCWWHQGSRCLSGNALYHIPNFIHIKFHQYIDILSSSIENFPTFCVTFSFKAPLKTPALTVLIHRVMAGVR